MPPAKLASPARSWCAAIMRDRPVARLTALALGASTAADIQQTISLPLVKIAQHEPTTDAIP